MNQVLTDSTASLSNLQNLSDDVAACGILSSDISQMEQIASQRSQELTSAMDLTVSAIPTGATLKSELVQALQMSLNADRDYVLWAEQQQTSGCAYGYSSSYYQGAYSYDEQAIDAKNVFKTNWGPVAAQYGYPASPNF